ncbi:hypothetical protein AtNW77_Chr1g0035751 [Arabidopsis thaliana]
MMKVLLVVQNLKSENLVLLLVVNGIQKKMEFLKEIYIVHLKIVLPSWKGKKKTLLIYKHLNIESTPDSDENGFEGKIMETNPKPLVLPESLKWGNTIIYFQDAVQVVLISRNPQKISNLMHPQVSCKPNLTMKYLLSAMINFNLILLPKQCKA